MPRDPFADDPDNDPSRLTEFEEDVNQLTNAEIDSIRHDLELLETFLSVHGDRGYLGIRFYCDHCNTTHYYDWDLLALHMQALIEGKLPPPHESSIYEDNQRNRYLTWDYCVGYLDGMKASGYRWF